MSKRFGRRQKWAARERIAELEQGCKRWQCRHDEVQMLGARNRQIVEDTARVLGKHFITLDPQTIEIQSINHIAHGWRETFAPRTPCEILPEEPISATRFLERTLPVLRMSSIAQDLQMNTHIRFTYNGRQVGYGVSESVLSSMPRGMLLRNLSEAMAEQMLDSFNRTPMEARP